MEGTGSISATRPAGRSPSSSRDAWALTGICLGFFVVLFDATAVNVATSVAGRELGMSLAAAQWILTAFTVAFASVMLSAGSLGARWGSRRTYLIGLLVFAAASALCASAPSAGVLITARAIQGVGAAAVVPCSLALIADRYPAGPHRSRALGVWGGVSGVGLAAGPVLGGWLVAGLGWRSVFLVVVPVAAVSLAMVAVLVDETPRRSSARVDGLGQVLAAASLVGFTTAFGQSASWGWAATPTIVLLTAAVAAGCGFVVVERRVREPMLPLGLLKARSFGGATAVGLLFNFALYGVLFAVTIVLEAGRGIGAGRTGLALLPLTAVVAASALASGPVTARHGPRTAMLLGLTGGLTGTTLLALFGDRSGVGVVAVFAGVVGLVGLAMPAMTGVALTGAGPERSVLGAAILNTARQAGGALGIALLGSLALGTAATPHLRTPLTLAAAAYVGALVLTAVTVPRAGDGP